MIRWFQSGKKGQDKEIAEIPGETQTVQKSLALGLLIHQLREGQKYKILDLGSAVGQNVDFFSQFPCQLYIEDLYNTLNSFDYFSPEDGFSYEVVFSYLLPYFKNTRFDLILTWDILNYLEREEARHLILHLSQFSRKGTMMFSLLSNRKHIPETPHIFKIVDREHIIYQVSSNVLRTCPRYEGRELDRLLPNFRVCNSFLLRNGFKEYIFVCD